MLGRIQYFKDNYPLEYALFLEEAHNLLGPYQTAGSKEGILETIIRQIRELGEALLLDLNQKDFIRKLEVGQAIVKLKGRFFKPFLVKIPLFPLKKGKITNEDIKKKMGGYSLENEVIRAKEIMNDLNKELRGYVKKENKDKQITEEEKKFLEDIFKFPISGVVERYQRMGINAFRGNRIKNSLLEKDMIYWKGVATLKGRVKILLLTHKGKIAIGKPKRIRFSPETRALSTNTGNTRLPGFIEKKVIR